MKKALSILVLISVMAVVVGTSYAQDLVTATLVTQQTSPITVGDIVTLSLEVTHPTDWRVVLPDLASSWGDIEVLSQATPEINANADSTETTSQQIEVAMFAPGEYQTQPLMLTVVNTEGQTVAAQVNSIRLVVESVLVEGDTVTRDIKPLASFVQSVDNPTWPIVGGLVLLVVAAGVVMVYWWRRPTKAPEDKRTPRQRALDRLDEIAAANLLAQGNAKEHYAQVSMCLRAYLEAELGLKALEQTTSEIVKSLEMRGAVPEFMFGVRSALRACDMVVYASSDPNDHDAIHLSALMRSLITSSPFAETDEPASGNSTEEAID